MNNLRCTGHDYYISIRSYKLLLLAVTLAWWAIVVFSSGDGASGEFTRRLLHQLFGLTGQALETANFAVRKFAHVVYYFVLTLLLASSMRAILVDCRVRAVVYAGLLAFLTGVLDEARQALSPLRTGTAVDLLYDGAGILLGAWVYIRASASR